MAKNETFEEGDQLQLVPTSPASDGLSGDPCLVGQIPGVLVTDQGTDDKASVDMEGAYRLPVNGFDGTDPAAIAPGDIIYFVDGDDPPLSVDTSGVRYGYALEAIEEGDPDPIVATIIVKLGY